MMMCALSENRSAVFFSLPTSDTWSREWGEQRWFPVAFPRKQLDINGLLRTAHVSQFPTRCPGAFCRIGLYYPAGFRTRDFLGCTPSMLPLGDNCAPASAAGISKAVTHQLLTGP